MTASFTDQQASKCRSTEPAAGDAKADVQLGPGDQKPLVTYDKVDDDIAEATVRDAQQRKADDVYKAYLFRIRHDCGSLVRVISLC